MDDDLFPVLFEVSNGLSHPLGPRRLVTFGGEDRADVGLDGIPGNKLLFQIELRGDAWTLLPWSVDSSLTVNRKPIRGRVTLQHRAIIQTGPHVLLFIDHDDPSVSTKFSAGQYLVGQMLTEPSAEDSAEPPESESSDDKAIHAPSLLAELGTERSDDDATLAGPPSDELTLRQRPTGEGPSGIDVNLTQTLRPDQFPTDLSTLSTSLSLPGEIELSSEQMLIGRDSKRVSICLPDLRVSRVHAWILRRGDTATIADMKSANGTFVDGERVVQPKLIREGSRIQIGPYSLIFTGAALFPLTHDKNAELVALNLVRRVPDRENRGKKKVILDDISLAIRPQEFVCILGPSGAGKSVLLSALTARRPADEGSVLLNGEDLYAEFDALKQNLAVVPQKDVLHDVLPLDRALWYTAKLRLPADMSRADIDRQIDEMLNTVRLSRHRSTQIRRLSGGQGKRASWVNEAICNPSLIFLDEVTSGLDEQTDSEMMQLFRGMADDGKTIVCVTHSVTYVEQNCDLVVILVPGGKLAFVGPPTSALKYFNISRLGDVYQRLTERSPEEWKEQFRESPQYERYVTRRLPEPTSATSGRENAQATRSSIGGITSCWRQFWLLTRRYLAIQLADIRPLAMMLGQSLFIAALLVWLFGSISNLSAESEAREMAEEIFYGSTWEELFEEDREKFLQEAKEVKQADYSAKVMFLLCISCLWFGCNNAAKELVKERSIYNKERDVGLNVVSYYGSKLALLGAFSVLQAAILFWGVRHFTGLSGDAQGQWYLLSLASLIGVAMGLAISAIANSSDLAATIVPISLLPQIILAGLIAPLKDWTRPFAQAFISAYWGYQGLLGQLAEPLTEQLRKADQLDLGTDLTAGVVGNVMMAHVLLFSLLAITALYARDARDAKENLLMRLLRRSG